jgi:hypothetical protein
VKIKDAAGQEKTLWGIGLEKAVEGLDINERIQLTDRGTMPTVVKVRQQDGTVIEKDAVYRVWDGRSAEADVDHSRDKEPEGPVMD